MKDKLGAKLVMVTNGDNDDDGGGSWSRPLQFFVTCDILNLIKSRECVEKNLEQTIYDFK